MEAKLQRRIQRYGWDLGAEDYEPPWAAQLAVAQRKLLECAAPAPGERVLDVACGTGLIAFGAAAAVGPDGHVLGVDLSDRMVDGAQRRAHRQSVTNTHFLRMDAERLALADEGFDVALCALGLMYMPDPEEAVREMRRVVRPGGRVGVAVWGERSRCGWSPVFPIVEAEVSSELCPLFFRLGQEDTLADLCTDASLQIVGHQRISTTLVYADADEACGAAFAGGPVALAWSRFDARTRARVCERYIEAIGPWRDGKGFRLPGEFVIVTAMKSTEAGRPTRCRDLRW
jgi:SAM-dependent methyltransferase